MLTLESLAVEVKNHIQSGIIEFQRFLSRKQIYDHPQILKVFSDMMAIDIFTHQQKQLTAGSLKFILTKRLNQNYKLYLNPTWDQYFTFFIERQPGDQIQWKYLSLTINAIRYLVQQLSQECAIKSIEKFNNTNFMGKVILMHAFMDNNEISPKNLYLFFTQTIDQFLQQVQSFLRNLHHNQNGQKNMQQITINMILFERDIITVIDEWLQLVSIYKGQGWGLKLDQLAINQNLVYIIKQEMKLQVIEQNNECFYKISDDLVTFCDDSISMHKNKTQNMSNKHKQHQKILHSIMEIKSSTLNILNYLVKSYSVMSGLQKFDTISVLSLVEILTPILIEFIDRNDQLKSMYQKSDDTELTTVSNFMLASIFNLLNTSATFNFLMQPLSSYKSQILYSIFITYLQANNNQIQAFQNDAQEFIQISENFIENQSNNKFLTPKQTCGNFMQNYLKLINTVQIQFIEFLSDSLKFHINKQKSQSLKQIQSQGYKIPSIQTIYSILTRIYFFADKSNQYFLNFTYQHFVNQQFVFSFKNIQKVRFLIFIQYSYGQYFKKNNDQGSKYLKFSFQTKDKTDVQFLMFLQLMHQCFDSGIAQNIWEYLMNEIEITKQRKFLSLIHKLHINHINNFPKEKIEVLIRKIKNRIKSYIMQNKQQLKQPGTCYDILYKCFQIVQTIAENKQLMSQDQIIMGEILQIIDFFNQNQLECYEFNCQVIKILNSIMQISESIPIQFEKYLNTMSKIVQNNKFYGPLLQTYYLILLKGGQAFQQKPQFLQTIKSSIEQKILSKPNRTQQMIIESIFLLQNIYLVYPHLIKQNRNLFDATQQIYDAEKENVSPDPKIVASILLFWMAAEYAYGNYNLGTLKDCKIEIFKQQFGLMFALNLKKLIQKYYQSQSIAQLLKLSIKLLDYEHYYKNNKNYKGPVFTLPIFKKYLLLDSFEQVNASIQFLRQNLTKQQFSQSIEILQSEVGIQVVNQLLKKRIFNNRTERKIIHVKRN